MSYVHTNTVPGARHQYSFSPRPLIEAAVRVSFCKALAIACALMLALSAIPLHAQTYHDLFEFDCGDGDGGPGCQPLNKGQLAQGSDGNFYGTTDDEGAYEIGTIFVVSPDGSFQTDLWSFDYTTGAYPNGGLTLASDGNFYGTAFGGGDFGDGTVFRFTPPSTITVLHSFSGGADGGAPWASPVQGIDGNLYGVTGQSTVYRITLPAGAFQVLPHKAPGGPTAPLVLALDGNLYGTTDGGGKHNKGTVFRLTTAGAINTIYSFSGPDGSYPTSPLTYGMGGNLLGTTSSGGANNTGTIFKLTTSGALTTLHDFSALSGGTNSDGASPLAGLLYASDGNLYGPTPLGGADGNGTLFEIGANGANFQKLYDFSQGGPNGSEAWTTLVEHTNGSYYGLTAESGSLNWGNFYSLVPASPIPILRVAGPIWVTPGQPVEILGNDLTQVTSVTFGPVPTSFRVGSDTYMMATVPAGAVDGVIDATLRNGEQIKTQRGVFILPKIDSFNPSSGAAGTQVNIQGGGFTGATQVTFGGVSATNFTVVSAAAIQAKVPAGAKSGKIKVTTPNGSATSTQKFKVK